ncbi:hypothetical protein SADUNF_Sadunf16G0064300 [Salix dunnii]|uniref:Uncharacterized protein n=1 Tax=Salix dunnii TaxID=1413687 RepID=A0A835MPH9_9ROSI|nr:hypothetical protein SADUNF_Sadunf16G0064300 [Salix dunnii]
MNELNNLGTVLAVVFSVCLAALVFEILYVLWFRRRFRGRNADGEFGSSSDSFYPTPSKELLYFFCWNNQTTRIEPDSKTPPEASAVAPPVPVDGADALVEEMLKLQGMHGTSIVFSTIKEEEMEVTKNDESSITNEPVENKRWEKSSGDFCFEGAAANDVIVEVDHVVVEVDDEAVEVHHVVVEVDDELVEVDDVVVEVDDEAVEVHHVVVEVDDVTTPFWTPCASPQHCYTPAPSPPRVGNLSRKNSGTGNAVSVAVSGDSGENTTKSFVSIETHSL